MTTLTQKKQIPCSKLLSPVHSLDAGFTLIEVLVAMLILAIGLLGVAALQFKGLQFTHDSYLRSQITFLAYDIADRMRLNRTNAELYISNGSANANNCNRSATITDPQAYVNNDLACWQRNVDSALPPGSTNSITHASNGETFAVTLGWTDREGNTRNVVYNFNISDT